MIFKYPFYIFTTCVINFHLTEFYHRWIVVASLLYFFYSLTNIITVLILNIMSFWKPACSTNRKSSELVQIDSQSLFECHKLQYLRTGPESSYWRNKQ